MPINEDELRAIFRRFTINRADRFARKPPEYAVYRDGQQASEPSKHGEAVRLREALIIQEIIALPQEAPSSDVVGAIELWFFRDILDNQRRALFTLAFGKKVSDEAKPHAWQRMLLHRLIADLTSTAGDTLKAELEQAYGALRWVYVHGVQSSHIRPAKITEIFNDAFASHRIAQDWSPEPRTALGSDQ